MDDEATRATVGLGLDMTPCVPHVCQCGEQVDASGIHSFVCKRASDKIARHHAINIFARAPASADVPSTKEPNSLLTADNKRPGLTFVLWNGGKPLA